MQLCQLLVRLTYFLVKGDTKKKTNNLKYIIIIFIKISFNKHAHSHAIAWKMMHTKQKFIFFHKDDFIFQLIFLLPSFKRTSVQHQIVVCVGTQEEKKNVKWNAHLPVLIIIDSLNICRFSQQRQSNDEVHKYMCQPEISESKIQVVMKVKENMMGRGIMLANVWHPWLRYCCVNKGTTTQLCLVWVCETLISPHQSIFRKLNSGLSRSFVFIFSAFQDRIHTHSTHSLWLLSSRK